MQQGVRYGASDVRSTAFFHRNSSIPKALARLNALRQWIIGFLMVLGLGAMSSAWATAGTYRLYIDSDTNAATGCTASLTDRFGAGSETGFEYQLTTTVDAAGNASGATLATCVSGSFTGADPVGQTAPHVAVVTAGANRLAQLELSVPATAVGATPSSRIVVAADGDYLNRLYPDSASAITFNGAATGTGAASTPQPIPSTSTAALVVLALLLGGLGVVVVRAVRRGQTPHWLMVMVFIAVSGSGIAGAVLAIDGNTDDWNGLTRLASDITGDQVTGTADLHSLTASFQDDQLFLRIDAVESTSSSLSLSVLDTESTLPRFATHPSLVASVGQLWSYQPSATDQAGQTLSISLTQSPAGMQLTGAAPSQQLAWTPTAAGTYWVTLRAQDSTSQAQIQTFPLYVSDDRQLPVDPSTIATALSPTGFTPFAEHTAFLYTGANPIQTGMQSGAIDPVTATVVRGQVLDSNGQPLPGATVRIAGHPEYGTTRSRADGWYDLAANGGGWITVHIEKLGYMSAQRRFQAPWRDWAVAPEVVLLPYDPQYTRITAGASQPQLYWGSTISDGRGDRRTSVYFPTGTQATAIMPDGSTRALSQMNVRVSEYTVGAWGGQAMPADLNMAVGYTWAANFTVDEAETIGAKSVTFSKPVVTYVDNFIDMPVGTAVPAGWYDFDKTAWIGEDNGRILKVLGVDATGKASVQVTTDERAATSAELAALGFDDDELALLARTRAVGTKLWRVRMTHFTPWDCNWPWAPPDDVDSPPSDTPPNNNPPDNPPPEPCPPGQICCPASGCDIFTTGGVVGQGIDLPGTSFSMYYRSDRIAMEPKQRAQRVRVTGSTRPNSLIEIQVKREVAGQIAYEVIPRVGWQANQTKTITWDGLDAYGRAMQQGVASKIRVSYVYPLVRVPSYDEFARAFERLRTVANASGAGFGFDRSAMRVTIFKELKEWLAQVTVPSPELNLGNAGAWALRGLRLYDPSAERLYDSGGTIMDAKSSRLPTGFSAQTEISGLSSFIAPPLSALGADGALYFSDTSLHQIRRVWLYGARKGTVETVAGTGAAGYTGDGGLATAAQLNRPAALAIAPDGAIVFMDQGNYRLRRVTPSGLIETVAGNGVADSSGQILDGASALQQPVSARSLAVARDMTIWAIASYGGELRQISPGGVTSRYALTGERLNEVVASPDGRVWLVTDQAIYQFSDVGALRNVVSFGGAFALLPDREGGVYFKDAGNQYNHLDRAGSVTVLGDNYLNITNYGIVTPLGTDSGGHLVSMKERGSSVFIGILGAGVPPFGESTYRISTADGNTVEEFDRLGRPTGTRSTFGGQLLSSYQYDANGQLASSTDSHGNTTTFERNGQGQLTVVVGPFGQRTTLSYSGNQLTQVQQPGGLTHNMSYASATSNLLTSYRDARGGVDSFTYSPGGRLRTNSDAAGGGWTLTDTSETSDYWPGTKSYGFTAQSAEGRVSQNQIRDQGSWGIHSLEQTRPDGTKLNSVVTVYGGKSMARASGLFSNSRPMADPRLGAMASPSYRSIYYGGGLAGVSSSGVNVDNADDANAWQSPSNWRQTTLLHQRDSWTTDYLGSGQFRQTTPMGRTLNVTLNDHQQAQSATLPSGLQLGYTYNSAGQLTGVSGTDGSATRSVGLTWNSSGPGGGQVASRTNALGQTERFAYNAAGRLSSHTLIDGRSLSYSWDAAGNLSSLTTPAGVTHTFSYNAVQLPTGYTAPAGGATQWQYDRDRKLTSVVRPGGQSLTFSRLASGQLASISDSTGPSTSYSWRSDGQLASASTGDGQAIAYAYNGALVHGIGATLQGTTASLGLTYERTTSYWNSDNFTTGRIASLQLTAGGQTQTIYQGYNADGQMFSSGPVLLGRDQATGQVGAILVGQLATNQQLDAWGQLSSASTNLRNGGFNPLAVNNQNALRALIKALGERMDGAITLRGDCVAMVPASTQICEYKAPASAKAKSSSIKKAVKSALKSQAQATTKNGCIEGSVTTAEDAAAYNLPWPPRAPEWEVYDSCRPNLQLQISNMLWVLDNRPNPSTIQSMLNQLISQFSSGPSAFISASQLPAPTPSTFGTTYIDSQAQQLIDQINATLTAWQANQAIWGTALAHTYTRDALGRVTQASEVLLGQTQPTKQYQYDSAGRLASAKVGSTTTTWGYDANGNRTQENGAPIASYNSQDQLQSWRSNTYSYNAAGDLSQRTSPSGTRRYTYDSQGNLRQVTLEDGKVIRYAIDPANRRTGKTLNGQLQWQLVWQSQLRPIARLKADHTLEATYYYGDKPNVPEAMLKDGKTYRIVTDQLGSVRLVLDADTGDIAQQMDYDVWGNVIEDTNPNFQPFGYAGGLYDPDTGLTRFGARDYDAETGRWTAKDPILFNGGDSNLYGYVIQDPVNWNDPLGLETCLLTTVTSMGFRDHAAIYTSRGDGKAGPVIYDPAGAYSTAKEAGSGDIITGPAASIIEYRKFHNVQTVELTCKSTSQAEEESIIKKAMDLPSAIPGQCSIMSSNALNGQPSFPNVESNVVFPGNLMRQIK